MKLSKNKDTPFYTQAQIEKRSEEIPTIGFLPGSSTRSSPSLGFSDCEELMSIHRSDRDPLPASIEYLPNQRVRPQKFDVFHDEDTDKTFLEAGSKITRALKNNFAREIDQEAGFRFEVEGDPSKLQTLTHQPEQAPEEMLDVNLASDEKVDELTKLHMDLYSVLSRVQEVRIASDLKAAYDIQDRISYVLDNKTLLLADLVDELIKYLQDIVNRLAACEKEIRIKQIKFNEFNSRVSKLKEYKYKTDLSFQLLDDNKAEIESEIERNLKILKDGTSA